MKLAIKAIKEIIQKIKRFFCKHEFEGGFIHAPHILPMRTWGYFCKKCGFYNGTSDK